MNLLDKLIEHEIEVLELAQELPDGQYHKVRGYLGALGNLKRELGWEPEMNADDLDNKRVFLAGCKAYAQMLRKKEGMSWHLFIERFNEEPSQELYDSTEAKESTAVTKYLRSQYAKKVNAQKGAR